MTVQLNLLRQPEFDLRPHYTAIAMSNLRMLWRARALIAGVVAIVLVLTLMALALVPREYTAEAIIQLDFTREDATTGPLPTPGSTTTSSTHATSAPAVTVEGAALAESEARLLSSRTLARKVAIRLGLDKTIQDPSSYSAIHHALNRLRMTLLPEYTVGDQVEQAAIHLEHHLNVVTVPRSYLMLVSFKSRSPEQAALVANTFAQEYFKAKSLQNLLKKEAAAHQEVLRLSSVYGSKHPSLVAAEAHLDTLQQERIDVKNPGPATELPIGANFTPAQANPTPSSPKGILTLAFAFVGSLLCGVGLAYWRDRKTGGFRTPAELAAYTGYPCLGVVPERDEAEATNDLAIEDALQAICVDARVIAADDSCKVVMIASAREEDGASDFTNALFEFLRVNGYRVLCIDPRRAHTDENAYSLKKVLSDSEAATALISADRDRKGALVCLGSDDDANTLPSVRSMKRFLTSARKTYDVVLIKAPPVLAVPQSALLGHVSDLCLHIVPWKKTPRRVIMSSLSRLKNALVPISGTILTSVSPDEYKHYREADSDHVRHGGYFDERTPMASGVE